MTEFILANPEVLRLRASQGQGQPDSEIEWSVSYTPEPVEAISPAEGDRQRIIYPVIGTLRTSGATGWGDISVGGLLIAVGEPRPTNLVELLQSSVGIESLYDIARGHLGPLLRTVDAVEELPRRSPQVTVIEFDDEIEDEDETADAIEDANADAPLADS